MHKQPLTKEVVAKRYEEGELIARNLGQDGGCARTQAIMTVKSYKALAKRSRKYTQVENFGLLATSFGQALRALALTCDDFPTIWSRSNLHASQSKFISVWPPNPSQHKLNDVH